MISDAMFIVDFDFTRKTLKLKFFIICSFKFYVLVLGSQIFSKWYSEVFQKLCYKL